MKKETFLLKLSLIFVGLPILTFCIYIIPWMIKDAATGVSKIE